jgi:hypothetical protein
MVSIQFSSVQFPSSSGRAVVTLRHQMPLDPAAGRVFAPYRPSGDAMVIDFGVKSRVVAL